MPSLATVPVLSYQDLISQASEHNKLIEDIKQEIGSEIDNINDPEPLFEQLKES